MLHKNFNLGRHIYKDYLHAVLISKAIIILYFLQFHCKRTENVLSIIFVSFLLYFLIYMRSFEQIIKCWAKLNLLLKNIPHAFIDFKNHY